MSQLVLRFLSVLHTNQMLQVRWKSIDNSFSVYNGVKQGGVLSLVLFAVHIDGLLNKLKNSGLVVIWEINLWAVYHLLMT